MTQTESHPPSLLVFNFRLAEGHLENQRVATYKATLQHIQAVGGEPLAGSEESVAAPEIDAKGRYRRAATGWGELA